MLCLKCGKEVEESLTAVVTCLKCSTVYDFNFSALRWEVADTNVLYKTIRAYVKNFFDIIKKEKINKIKE